MARDLRTFDMFAPPPAAASAQRLRGPEHDGLRYFQLDAYHAIRASLEANRSTLLVLATGLGKTQTFSSVAKHWPGRVLVLAHRDELVGQAKARLEEMTGEYVEIEQGQLRSGRARIVVGSIQTVQRAARLEALSKNGGFSLVIADECFPAGTLVDGKPIEDFAPGDTVRSVDHRTGEAVSSQVTAVSRKLLYSRKMTVLRIGESTVECTGNHPVFVKGKGYVKAEGVEVGDLLCVRMPVRVAPPTVSGTKTDVFTGVQVLDLLDSHGSDEQARCLSANEGQKPDAKRGYKGEGQHDSPAARAQALDSGRQWLRANRMRIRAAVDSRGGVVHSSYHSDGSAAWKWVPDVLQAGRRESELDGIGGSGWLESQHAKGASGGREEDEVLEWARVGSVSSDERRSEGGFAVYDLEVAGTHTYFANGVLVHNCHHYVAKSFRRPLDHFKDAKILGVTATPDRGDAKALGQIFDDVAYTMDICAGIQAGYLVPLVGKEVTIKEVDLDQVSVNAGDLAAGELDEAMLKGVEGVVSGMLNYSKDKQGVIFLPGVKSAHLTAARLNAQRPGCAVSLDGETDPDTRRQIVKDFKDGKVQFLSNCMVATEGFDAPAAAVIGLARPTKSRAMYAQCAGRGTRVLPGVVDGIHGADGAEARRAAIAASAKPSCMLIDFVGLNTKHSLMTPEDLLGGEYDDATKQKARKMKEENPDLADTDVTTLLEMSHLELARIAAKVKSRVKASHREFDPFAAFGVDTKSVRKYELEYGYKPITERQLAFLAKSGFKPNELDGRSFREASKLIDQVIKRREAKLASRNQLAALHKRGITDPNISFEAASRALDYIAQNGWGTSVDPVKLNAIVNAKEGELL